MGMESVEPAAAITVPIWPEGVPGSLGNSEADNPCLHFYQIKADAPTACILIFPGGSYRGLAVHEGAPVARWLNSLGVCAAVLHYRVHPYRHPCQLLDAQRALRTLRYRAAEWGIDPQRIGVLGFSAGGHLAATISTHYDDGQCGVGQTGAQEAAVNPVDQCSCRPDLQILGYPVISFTDYVHVGSVQNLLGPAATADDLVLLSNEQQVTADTPPAFIWHTANDPGVPVEHSLMYATALSKHGVPFALHIYPDGRHGLGLADENPYVSPWTHECALFLAQRGFLPKVSLKQSAG